MSSILQSIVPKNHPLRLFYHKLIAVAAAFWYRFPASKLTVIAVTGTTGKTTTCNLIHHIFQVAGRKTGLITTINFKVGNYERVNPKKSNAPGPFFIQRLLREMVDTGCTHAILEVTDRAMMESRIWGVNVDTAVFTNLSQNPSQEYSGIEAYRQEKARLFSALNVSDRKPGVSKMTVINLDDPEGDFFAEFPIDQLFEFGIQRGTYVARNLEAKGNGTRFLLRIPNGEETIDFKIPGRTNVYHALAAATVAVAHQIPIQKIKEALEEVQFVPGRLELISEGQPFHVIVDSAHTPEALENLLPSLKEITPGKLIVVFGSGEGQSAMQRQAMGEVLSKHADLMVLTNDDFGMENPLKIAQELRTGIQREEGDRFWQILDRHEAIRFALAMGKTEADTVLVAGKGAETVQIMGRKEVPHDDRVLCRELLHRSIDVTVE